MLSAMEKFERPDPNAHLTPFGKVMKAIGVGLMVLAIVPFGIALHWYDQARHLWRWLTLKAPDAK